MAIPKAGEYDDGKFWFSRTGKILTLGLMQETANNLGSVENVELPAEGDDFVKGDVVATVLGSQGELELTTPAAGLVKSLNGALQSKPALIEEDAGEEGWIVQIEIEDPTDLEEYADAE